MSMLPGSYCSNHVRCLWFLMFSFDFILLAATCFVHIVAIIMTAIMILHIRSKYTAVGRKEIVMFFWMYAVIELLAMFLDSGVIPSGNATYPVCVFLLECHARILHCAYNSGLRRYIQALLLQRIAVCSLTDLWASNSLKMEHLSLYGFVFKFFLI